MKMQAGMMQCLVASMAFLAMLMSVVSVSWCEFVDFTLPTGREISFGPWRYSSFSLVVDNDGDVWKVGSCNKYPDDVSMDSYWKTARAMLVLAPCLGTVAGIAIFCRTSSMAKVVGLVLLIVTTCQGLTFLFFKSDACGGEKNPLFEEYPDLDINDCEMAGSAIVSIVAACLWFIAGAIACAFNVEDGEGAGAADDIEKEAVSHLELDAGEEEGAVKEEGADKEEGAE